MSGSVAGTWLMILLRILRVKRGDIKPTASGQSEGNYNVFREGEWKVIISRMAVSIDHAKFN